MRPVAVLSKLRPKIENYYIPKVITSLRRKKQHEVRVDANDQPASHNSNTQSEQKQKKGGKFNPLSGNIGGKEFQKRNESETIEREGKSMEQIVRQTTQSKKEKEKNKHAPKIDRRQNKKPQQKLEEDNWHESPASVKSRILDSLKQIHAESKDTYHLFEQENLELSHINAQLKTGFVEYDCRTVDVTEELMLDQRISQNLKSLTDLMFVLSEQTLKGKERSKQKSADWDISKLVEQRRTLASNCCAVSDNRLECSEERRNGEVGMDSKCSSSDKITRQNNLQRQQGLRNLFQEKDHSKDNGFFFLSDSSYSSDIGDDDIFYEEYTEFVASRNPIVKCDPYKASRRQTESHIASYIVPTTPTLYVSRSRLM